MHDPEVHRWEKRRRGETKGLSYSVGQLERRKMATALEKIKLAGQSTPGGRHLELSDQPSSQDL